MMPTKEKRENNDLAVAKHIIANCRDTYGITQAMIARESGEGLSLIQKIASQTRSITPEQLQNIKDAATRLVNGESKTKEKEEILLSQAYYTTLVTNFKKLSISQKKALAEFSTFVKSIID